MKTLLIRDVPKELHKKFKTLCCQEGVSMTDKIKEMIKKLVSKKPNQ